MMGRLSHVAIAVPDLAAAMRTYADGLGAAVSAPRDLPRHGVRIAFVTLPNGRLELMEPLGDASPVAAFLERNPQGGLHHICFEVADLGAARDRLVGQGLRVLGTGEPEVGAHGHPVLFLHPKDVCGTLVELEEVAP